MFKRQFANVVEWQNPSQDAIFWKWPNDEIKKGSRLILRPGQDAIFFNNGRIEGIFKDDGDYDIESKIIPFLSTLKGFKFGFNSGLRVEVLFVNTREFEVKWGTKSPVLIPTPQLPGGLPIRANGNLFFKIDDYISLIDNIAGVGSKYFVEDVRMRITSVLDQLLMKWISKEGKNMFNLQANASEIAAGIREDLDMDMIKNGMTVVRVNIMSFNYPKEIQDMLTKAASHSMIGDMDKYTQVAMTDSLGKGGGGNSTASQMTEMMMGMKMAEKMMGSMDSNNNNTNNGSGKKFCSNCGTPATGKFCGNCGSKL